MAPRRRDALLVFGVALAARLAVVGWARSRIPPTADGVYYVTLARRLASGAGYTWRWPDGVVTHAALYPVGYPAILALAFFLVGSSAAVGMVVNSLFGAAGAYAVHRLVDGSDGIARWRPLAAGLAVALHPALVPYTAACMTEGVTASLLVMAVAAAARARAQPAAAHAPGTCLRKWFGGPPTPEGLASGGKRGGGPALEPASRTAPGVAGSPSWPASREASGARGCARAARRGAWWAAAGIAIGVATLVRPQSILVAPVLGLLAMRPPSAFASRLVPMSVVLGVALACVLPWTARNCVQMHRCALVSVNGGWNLLIGTRTTGGAYEWSERWVPTRCAHVWDEAAKDVCFERAAREAIVRAPLAWVARVPAKLAVTFDYFGAAPWYLHDANAAAFDSSAKTMLGIIETIACRLLLVGALFACALRVGPRRRARGAIALGGVVAAVTRHGWLGYAALVPLILLLGRRELARVPILVPATAGVMALTMATHAVFFGAGRYGLVVLPLITALAFVGSERAQSLRSAGSR